MSTVYTISSNYNGRQHSVKFFPGGYGNSYVGYITTLEQLQDELNDTYDNSSFKLMYISSSCKMNEIEDDHDLFQAVRDLEDGTCLPVTLFENTRKSRKSTRKRKEHWYGDWSSTDSSSSSSSYSSLSYYQARGRTSYRGNLGEILQRFMKYEGSDEYHYDHQCHHCDKTKWSGARYEYSMHSGYSMCEGCHDDLSRKEKKLWPLASESTGESEDWVLPWDADVPAYPLYREEGCPVRDETRHLQYLLTRIGAMPLKDTDALTGSYQGRTQRAVEKFRREHGIHGDDMTVYNKKTARKLAQVVQQLRSAGHEYL